MVSGSAVLDAVIVTEQVPKELPEAAVVQVALLEKVTSPLVANVTGIPPSRFWWASVTVAVAVDVDVPSAVIEDGLKATETAAADPGVWVRVALPCFPPAVARMV